MQRDEDAMVPAPALVLEEPKPALSLEDLVPDLSVAAEKPSPPRAAVTPGLRTARLVAVEGRVARVSLRGAQGEIEASLAPEVERELIEEAAANKGSALVEIDDAGQATVVGLVQTRRPRDVHVTGDKIVVEANREVLLRAGRAALRLREDGDVELVGSRISAASRGLFRIVGRILRLN